MYRLRSSHSFEGDRSVPTLAPAGTGEFPLRAVRGRSGEDPGLAGALIFLPAGPGDGAIVMAGPLTAHYTRELYLRWRSRRIPADAPALGDLISSSGHVAKLFSFLRREPKEHLYSVHLDGANRIVGIELLGLGGMGYAPCEPSDVFRSALLSGARAILVVHQHPSGNPWPSVQDRVVTADLVAAGRLLRVPLVDHIILGNRNHYSFADRGELRGVP